MNNININAVLTFISLSYPIGAQATADDRIAILSADSNSSYNRGAMDSQDKMKERAISIAKNFLVSIGVKVADSDKPNVGKVYESDAALAYSVTYPYCHVAVDVIAGNVFIYNNSNYRGTIAALKAPPANLIIKDPLNARAFFSRYLQKLKIPSEYEPSSSVNNIKDFDPANPKAQTISIKAYYSPRKFGYSLGSLDYYFLKLNCENGELMEFMKYDKGPFVIESHELKLSGEEALSKAQTYLKQLGINATFGSYTKREVKYVIPNSFIRKFTPTALKKPAKLRLAWEFYVSDGEVLWVDAKDGRLLGGFWFEKG